MTLFKLAIALATLVASSPVSANDLFSTFKDFCVTTRADPSAALAAADKAGWRHAPLQAQNADSDFPNSDGRTFASASDTELLRVAQDDTGRTYSKLCVVASRPPQETAIAEAVAFAAVPSDSNLSSDNVTYLWQENGGAHIQVKTTPDGRIEPGQKGDFFMLKVKRDSRATGLELTLFRAK